MGMDGSVYDAQEGSRRQRREYPNHPDLNIRNIVREELYRATASNGNNYQY